MLWMLGFWSDETRVPYVSQDHWEEQGTCCCVKLEDDYDNEDDGILNAFIATVNPTEGIVEDVVEKMDEQDDIHTSYAKLYKVLEKHEKLHRLATKKLNDVELRALRFENNFLAEKTKKLEAKLFQVRAQLERTSSGKLDEMLILQKSASNQTGLGYDLSSPNIASTRTTVFVPSSNNVESKNNDV